MKRINEMEYAAIKALLNKGYEGTKVSEIVGRGRNVVCDVNTTGSYAEYIAKRRQRKARAKSKAIQRQLPLDESRRPEVTGNANVIDLRQSIWIKYNALYDELMLYRRTPTGKTTDEIRDLNMAVYKLEEAEMWLKRHW